MTDHARPSSELNRSSEPEGIFLVRTADPTQVFRMAEMTIRLQYDPETGKKDIIVTLRSDADLLPHEHEQQHRALVERLIEGGLITADELGQVIVSREEEQSLSASDPADDLSSPQTDQSDERRSQSESG